MKIDSRLVIPCLTVLIAQSGITLYLPALPSIAEYLHASDSFSALTLSAFLIGMGLPMLLWGNVAALLGNKGTLSWALFLFSVSSSGIALSTDTTIFVVCRAIQGVAAGGISVTARALLRESFSTEQLPRALSWLSICFVISMGLTQFAGALLHALSGWQFIFIASAITSVLLIYPVRHYLPCSTPKPLISQSGSLIYCTLIRDVRFLRPVLAGGLGYGLIILFGASAPALFQLHFNWTDVEYGLIGWPISGAYLMGALSVSWVITRRSQEHSLILGLRWVLAGALLMSAAHVLYPTAAAALWLPYCLLLVGQGLVYPLCQSLAAQNAAIEGPYAMALTGFIHQTIAAACGLISSMLPTGQPLPFTLTCVVIAALALGVTLLKATPRIRPGTGPGSTS